MVGSFSFALAVAAASVSSVSQHLSSAKNDDVGSHRGWMLGNCGATGAAAASILSKL